MKAMSDRTRMEPNSRMARLLNFNRRLCGSEDSQRVLRDWGLKLKNDLEDVPARILKSENIILGNGRK